MSLVLTNGQELSGTTTLTETGSSLTVQKEGVYKAEASVAKLAP
jgi:hypothetical protein